jgi:hypothetical protein
MSLQQGVNVIATLSGSAQNQSNQSYYTIGLSQNTKDEFGATVSTPFRIGLNATNHERLFNKIQSFKGKLVAINCNVRTVAGRNGGFLSFDANQFTDIMLIEPNNEK